MPSIAALFQGCRNVIKFRSNGMLLPLHVFDQHSDIWGPILQKFSSCSNQYDQYEIFIATISTRLNTETDLLDRFPSSIENLPLLKLAKQFLTATYEGHWSPRTITWFSTWTPRVGAGTCQLVLWGLILKICIICCHVI